MASTVLLLLLAALLPLRLRSLLSHLLIPKSDDSSYKNNSKKRLMISLVSIPLLLSATIFALSDLDLQSSKDEGLIAEVENLKLKIARLESILEENANTLSTKVLHLEENSKLIKEMEHRIQILQNSVSRLKMSVGSTSDYATIVTAMEEEVRLLWDESRKNNFEYHALQSKAFEEEKKVNELTSEVVKMENVITEQWIQIRQFEQSLQIMKIMTSKVHEKTKSKAQGRKPVKFTMLKFIKHVRHNYFLEGADVPDAFFLGNYISNSCMSRTFDQVKGMWSAVKEWHYKLQEWVKQLLEMNEFTAPLANNEVIFFLASAVVVMPVMSVLALFQ